MLILDDSSVKAATNFEEVLIANEVAFKALESGLANTPERIILDTDDGPTLFKPSHIRNTGLGLKVVSVRSKNADINLSTVPGFIALVDETTGFPTCLMNATYLTALRTAAGSALATQQYFPQARTLFVAGCGLQAQLHVDLLLSCCKEIQRVMVWNRTQEKAMNFVSVNTQKYPNVEFNVGDVAHDISNFDVICTCTNSPTPLFNGILLQDRRVHINAIGSFTPTTRELDDETIRVATTVLDSDSARTVGEFALSAYPPKSITTLGKLLHGEEPQLGGVSLFKSVGTAVQDIVTADCIFKNAVKLELGVDVPF